MRNNRSYFFKTFLMAWLLSPLIIHGGLLLMILPIPLPIVALITLIVLVWIWARYMKKTSLPVTTFMRYLPIFLSFLYYMFVFIIIFTLSGFSFAGDLWSVLTWLTLPYMGVNLLIGLFSEWHFFPLIQMVLYGSILFTMCISSLAFKKRSRMDKQTIAAFSVCVLVCVFYALQLTSRESKVLTRDYEVDTVSDEVNLFLYRPFQENSELQQLGEAATLLIESDYPIIDGATAAYPVYAAMAQEIYTGLDADTVEEYVDCTKTTHAYERLIRGEIDIFFGAQPSKQQLELAQEAGVEFTLTPIGREAFVFFVNQDNPVDTVTMEQIQDIYMKKITNWTAVGGHQEKIMAFQRPDNSGSQTIMLATVMKGLDMPTPLQEEFSEGMGGIMKDVATYRNYSSAIGYSFRFYATGMKPNDSIKLLGVNGIQPSKENIQASIYPLTVNVYAVTVGNESENTLKLIEWILSEQGQRFVEQCGYIGF